MPNVTDAEIVVPINLSRGLVEVEVTIDGHISGRFGIDTGADDLYIDRGFARAAGLEISAASRRRHVVSLAGTSSVAFAQLRSLRIDDEALYNVQATVVDIAELGGTGSHPDGLIGYSVLREFYITVDYGEATLTLQQEEPDFLQGNQYESIPFREVGHQLIVQADFGGISRPMLLDYCASHSLISPELAAELGLEQSRGSRVVIEELSLSDDIVSSQIEAVVQTHGNLSKSKIKPAFDGILGGTFLKDHVITVDYMRHQLHVHF